MENKYTKHIILILLLINLTGPIRLFGQNEHFNYQEEVILKTDRQLYLPGDQIQVHSIVLQAGSDQPSGLSGYIKIDLIGTNGHEYIQLSRSIHEGELFCNIKLPSTLETGYYKLRAYTNWIRNFGTEGFAEVLLKIVNPADENLHRYIDVPQDYPVETADVKAKPRSEISFSTDLPPDITKAWVKVSQRYEAISSETDNANKKRLTVEAIKDTPRHLPEIKQQILEGVITQNNQDTLGVDICINMLNNNYFDQTRTDKSGFFFFALYGQTNQTDFIISPVFEELKQERIEIWPFYEPGEPWNAPMLKVSEQELNILRKHSIYSQLSTYYMGQDVNEISADTNRLTSRPFFHPPDKSIILDDYIRLANVREVIYEVVPGVSVRKKNGKDVLKVYTDMDFANSFETLVLLDGIPLIDQEAILELPTDRIKSIEVKNQLYIHGSNLYAAIINFISPNNDYAGMDLPSNSLISGVILAPEWQETDWSYFHPTPRNIPNLQSTLLWIPITEHSSGELTVHTNDRTGWFFIEIYGLDPEGNLFVDQKKLLVSD